MIYQSNKHDLNIFNTLCFRPVPSPWTPGNIRKAPVTFRVARKSVPKISFVEPPWCVPKPDRSTPIQGVTSGHLHRHRQLLGDSDVLCHVWGGVEREKYV
jgi:hypothetical protein